MPKITTIKVSIETKSRLNKLKEHDRESYDSLIKKMLYILNTVRKDPEEAEDILKNIDTVIKRKDKYTKVYSDKEK